MYSKYATARCPQGHICTGRSRGEGIDASTSIARCIPSLPTVAFRFVEDRTTEYTVVAVEQDVGIDGNETIVHEQRELERLETRLSHDETWHRPFELEPTIVGENVRIAWLLYPEDVPDEPSIENAEYYAHLWISVDESD